MKGFRCLYLLSLPLASSMEGTAIMVAAKKMTVGRRRSFRLAFADGQSGRGKMLGPTCP
jgi:hypothetical protein